jgi:hypothetical protein
VLAKVALFDGLGNTSVAVGLGCVIFRQLSHLRRAPLT